MADYNPNAAPEEESGPPEAVSSGLEIVKSVAEGIEDDGDAGVLGAVGGGIDIYKGFSELQKGETGAGLSDLAGGSSGVTDGVMSFIKAAAEEGGPAATAAEDVGGPAGMVGGLISGVKDIMDGEDTYSQAKTTDQGSAGIGKELKGGLEVGGALLAPVLATMGIGVGAGMGMEEATKSSGILNQPGVVDGNGNPIAATGSDVAANIGQKVAEWIDPTVLKDDGRGIAHQGGSSTMATLAGAGATAAATPLAMMLDMVGTGAAGWQWLKKEL
jgi:hypothetical protein